MSLVVYETLPDDVKCRMINDSFFNACTGLKDSDFVRNVLMTVDSAKYNDINSFIDRNGVLQPRVNLSTGAKTLINVYENPDKCFFVGECGSNALGLLCHITAGYVYWPDWALGRVMDSLDCDILFNGIRYMNFLKFLNFRYYGDDDA